MAYYGIKSGMTYLEYIAFLFDLNATLKRKLSDEQLILKILTEFAYRKELTTKLTLAQLHKYRIAYNSGTLHSKYPAPLTPSFRYIKGAIVSRNKRAITPAELKLRLSNQLKRRKKYHARSIKKEITKKPRIKKKKRKFRLNSYHIRGRIRKAKKEFSKRYKLQKKMAKLHGVSPWPNA